MWRPKVITMFQMLIVSIFIILMGLQKINRFIIANTLERLRNIAFQKFYIAFQGFQSLRSTVKHTLDQGFNISFLQVK